MAVLKAPPKQSKTTVVQLRLDDEAKTKLTKYAEFLDCSPSYVVTEALKLVYNKHQEFQTWLSGQHTSNHAPSSKGESFQLALKQNPCTTASNPACVRTQRRIDDMAHA